MLYDMRGPPPRALSCRHGVAAGPAATGSPGTADTTGPATLGPVALAAWPLPQRALAWAAELCPVVRLGGWQLQFGPAADRPAAGEVRGLQVAGLAPWSLAWVQVLQVADVVYQLDSSVDRRGRLLLAGDLLHGMARMQGQEALVIDVQGLGLVPGEASLRLGVLAEAGTRPVRAAVSLLMC
jgi:hypothetical protein